MKNIVFCQNKKNPNSCGNLLKDDHIEKIRISLKNDYQVDSFKISTSSCLGLCEFHPSFIIANGKTENSEFSLSMKNLVTSILEKSESLR